MRKLNCEEQLKKFKVLNAKASKLVKRNGENVTNLLKALVG